MRPISESDDPDGRLRQATARGMRATVWGIVASTVLAVVKVAAGVLGHSYALVADGVESMLDIMSSMVVWGSLRIASQPATEDYPYGFGKAEPLAALVVATALLGASVGIAIQSLVEIRTPHHLPSPFTLVVLIFVILAKESMFRVLYQIGGKIGSKAMQTDAWHHRSDSLTSVAALIGISIALFAGEGFESADDWAALFASGVVAFNGGRLFRNALREILDVSPPPETVGRIVKIARSVPEVLGLDKCRLRTSGLVMFVDIHVIVDGSLSVSEGHRIAHEVKDALLASGLGIRDVAVHIEPGKVA
ncbi:cation diffusion facilitator family transporter [Verrucomicrobiales bacterium BCK34]|nr:cation diffusion facilitator family transporter [Verrucomicrobiales bacterium BCK34]